MKCFARLLRSFVLIVLLLLCFVSQTTAGTVSQEELEGLLRQGNDLFRQGTETAATDQEGAKGLFSKAAMYFERIVRDGEVQNGQLFYNIGNAYFRTGDLGKAILNYRRAEAYLPNDPNLRQNLEYARSRRQDKIEETERTRVLRTLLFWHYDLSARTRSVVFAVCSAFFWLGASIRLFHAKAPPRWVLGCLGFAAVLFLGSLIFEGVTKNSNTAGVILAEEVIGRKGDAETYQPSFKGPLHAGTEFGLVEDRNDWYQIELSDGRLCWIPKRAAELVL
jgi:tetratricopeptide (TPR) repeat protein